MGTIKKGEVEEADKIFSSELDIEEIMGNQKLK